MAEPLDSLISTIPPVSLTGLVFVFIVVTIVVAGFFVWWIMGRIKNKVDFEGRKICRMRITIQNKFTIEGNLSHNDSFDDDVLEQFELQQDVKVVKGIIDQLKKEKKLWIYNFNVTDDTDADEDFAKKTRIISPVQIESEDYSWSDQRERRPFSNPFVPEGRRNCIFVDSTKKIRIVSDDLGEEDYWIASVLPKSETKFYNTLYKNPFPEAPVNMFNTIVMHSAKGIAEIAHIAKVASKAFEFNRHLESERDTFKDLYSESLDKIEEINVEKNDLEESLAQKPYVISGKEAYKKQYGVGAVWILIAGISSGFMSMFMPTLFPTIEPEVASMIGIIVGMVVAGAGYMFFSSRVKAVQKVPYEEIREQ